MKRRMSQARVTDLVFDTPEVASEKGRRGGAKQNATNRVYVYVEGQPFTYEQLAARLGRSDSVVRARIKRERAKGGPLTWAGLGQERA